MKLPWKIAIGVVVVSVIGAGVAFYLLRDKDDGEALKMAQETRRKLSKEGFKVDLAEFDFSTTPELRNRAGTLLAWGGSAVRLPDLALMRSMGKDTAVVIWKSERTDWDPREISRRPDENGTQAFWPSLAEVLDGNRENLDAACEAALSGPIRFDIQARPGGSTLLPHLGNLKNLHQFFAGRMLLDIRQGNKNEAWTNLLAMTRLVTAWSPEPAEISHLVRYACTVICFDATWQALQTNGWSDEQLAQLQREWESVDFFAGLPDTAAFQRASQVAAVQLERTQPNPSVLSVFSLRELFTSPSSIVQSFKAARSMSSYRTHGTYEDERDLMLFFQNREIQLQKAIKATNWLQMRSLPGVKNEPEFQSKYSSSRVQVLINMRRIPLAMQTGRGGMLSKAAEAESRRRIIMTAIALERYHGRHGTYPNDLNELAPEFIKTVPVDFMDGKNLRYRLDDGHIVLYSVGMDGVDNGGKMRQRRNFDDSGDLGGRNNPSGRNIQETDLVWPRPASIADVIAYEEQAMKAVESNQQKQLLALEEMEIARDVSQPRIVQKLLQIKRVPLSKDPKYNGKPLSQLLYNQKGAGDKKITLEELLTLTPITTGDEPEKVAFEVPIKFETITNMGELFLAVDGGNGTGREEGEQECKRATNGNCLLVWNTTYEPAGLHVIQACLNIEGSDGESLNLEGPVFQVTTTNLFRFSHLYDIFGPSGATLYAKLSESNGNYVITVKSPSGECVKTFSGSTTNGVVKEHWDLIDEKGAHYTNQEFSSVFSIILPDSGRSQTLKGP